MAKRQTLNCTRGFYSLTWTSREEGMEVFTFDIRTVHADLKDKVYEYGVRQIIADGAAAATTLPERAYMMAERAAKLVDGTWGTREARLVDGDIFEAAVAAGLIPDSAASRNRWAKDLTANQRRAVGDRPDVKAHMPEIDGDDVADILQGF